MQKIKTLKVSQTESNEKILWSQVLSHRNLLLEKTDWTQQSNSGLTNICSKKYRDWRTRLKKIRRGTGIPLAAVVQLTKTIESEMPELEWEKNVKDFELSIIETVKNQYLEDINSDKLNLVSLFTVDLILLQKCYNDLLDFDKGFKTKDSLNLDSDQDVLEYAKKISASYKAVHSMFNDVNISVRKARALLNSAKSVTMCQEAYKKFSDEMDGHRYRLQQEFNS